METRKWAISIGLLVVIGILIVAVVAVFDDGGLTDVDGLGAAEQATGAEQDRYQEVLADAMTDDRLVIDELEAFALEAVACTRRAGVGSTLDDLDRSTGAATFSVEAKGAERGPGDAVAEACHDTFYQPALVIFEQTGQKLAQDAAD